LRPGESPRACEATSRQGWVPLWKRQRAGWIAPAGPFFVLAVATSKFERSEPSGFYLLPCGVPYTSRPSQIMSLRSSAAEMQSTPRSAARARHLGRVDDAGLDQVFVDWSVAGVVAVVGVLVLLTFSTTIAPSRPAFAMNLAERRFEALRTMATPIFSSPSSFSLSRPWQRAAGPRRRRGRCLLRPRRGWRAGRLRRGPSSPSSRSRSRRRP
jgi:hypothetical protein